MKTIGERLLRLPEVLERVPFWKTTLHARIRKGLFPQNIKLGSNMVAWVASEIEEWINTQIKNRKVLCETTEIEYLAALEVIEKTPINKKHKEKLRKIIKDRLYKRIGFNYEI